MARTVDESELTGGQLGDVSRAAVSITVCPNGPLLVRGDFEVLNGAGQSFPQRRRTIALCRCGFSAIKPYCDGSHKAAGFRTEDRA